MVPSPHGFYTRNAINTSFSGRILIRRYYCKHCGHTFSYLPSFCLPFFQYTTEVIFAGLLGHFFNMLPFLRALILSLHWQRQHMQFYRRRFKANLKRIQLVLRQLIPGVELPEPDYIKNDIKTGAQKVLSIVISGFDTIQAFSTRFFAQCNISFMAPCKLF
ncbi:MAG: DUF6431 domain-containing protein [Desulfotomaculaceae bacterium]|nr:DUF6431 domain-containing protein [Desulfotomaculaceae bacterium]